MEVIWIWISSPQIWRWYHSNGRKSRGTKEPLDEGEKGEWKSQLKTQHSKNWIHSIQSHHFMAIKGEKVGAVTDYFFLGSKITADGDCSHKIKRYLLLRRKAMINLDCVLKSRDITLSTKVHIAKVMVFPVVMYWCKSWTRKKAEGKRIDALWIVVLEKTLESTERRSN